MTLRALLSSVLLAGLLAGCGGGNDAPSNAPAAQATRLLADTQVTAAPVLFTGLRNNYTIAASATGFTVTDTVGAGGVTAVSMNARLRFADNSVALDAEKNGGQAYRLYQAAFNRLPDPAGLGYWINAMDNGATLNDVAAGFVTSAEFKAAYGTSTDSTDIVKAYYLNALRRVGDTGGIAYWLDVLNRKLVNQPGMLVLFSESPENQQAVLGAIQNGIDYIEPGVAYVAKANAGVPLKVNTGASAKLDGSASTGAAGKFLNFRWTLTSKPADSNAALAGSTSARPTFVADVPGTYVAELIVNDGKDSAPARVSVVADWKAPASAVPASGNYIYLQSDLGDYTGGGRNLLYTASDTTMTLRTTGALLDFKVAGNQNWSGQFKAMDSVTRLQPGYYGDLSRYPFHNVLKGGLNWDGDGRGCNKLKGWFQIDKITYSGDSVTEVDLRFEQHCEGGNPALRGQVHWTANDTTAIPGPVTPVPSTLWQPGAGLTPASGNYIYLSSSSGDYIGGGKNYLYTSANTTLKVSADAAKLSVDVAGSQKWTGEFVGMNTVTKLEPGYYPDLMRSPFRNANKGGLDWNGEGRGCNTLAGWFAVDSVTYEGTTLKAIDLRFEQRCEAGTSALRGKIHWNAADAPPG